eukprot:8694918-Pyramimonas_sp.AAC.1
MTSIGLDAPSPGAPGDVGMAISQDFTPKPTTTQSWFIDAPGAGVVVASNAQAPGASDEKFKKARGARGAAVDPRGPI